jgi:predicted DNA-binding transcriptional regulator YafY
MKGREGSMSTSKRALRHQRIVSYLDSVKEPKSLTDIWKHLNSRSDSEITRKTVERDILDLTDQYKIAESPGRPMKFHIPAGSPREYHLEFTGADLQALAVGITVLRNQGPEIFKDLTSLLEAKILHKLPTPQRKEMERFMKLCVARGDPAGQTTGIGREDILRLLEALRQGRAVKCVYESVYPDRKPGRERKFGLILLEIFGGTFCLLAEDLEIPAGEGRIRRLALPRFHKVEITDELYSPPAATALKKWESSYAGLGGDQNAVQKVVLEVGTDFGTYLSEHQIHGSQKMDKIKGGARVEFELPIGTPFLRFLAGFAWDIKRIEPKEVKGELLELMRQGMEALGQ